jgi:hypothetical protein
VLEYEQRVRRRPGAGRDVPVPRRAGGATPAAAVLALHAGAGNQAVARTLQRFYEKPDATRQDQPKNAKGKIKTAEGWTQNGREPREDILLQEGTQWYIWRQTKRVWQKTTAPAPVAAVPQTLTAPHQTPETEAGPDIPAEDDAAPEALPVRVPAPPRRYPLPDNVEIKDLAGHSGMSLAASPEAPVEMPGGNLPDQFVQRVFGYLDAPALLALRTASPWLFQHGSSALREHLHEQTEAHPKGRVGETLSSMSSLGATPLIDQYRNAIKARPPQELVVASDKVNANTIATLTAGLPRNAVTVHYGERTDRGGADDRFTHVQGPYDDGGPGRVVRSKMHNKLVVGATGDKGEFLLSGSPNLTASAMQANIESAVLIRYPGIAKLYKDYIDRVKTRTTDDPKFTKALKDFNRRDVVGIRAALAPFVDIGETLNAELQGADEITMRMYLVGSGEKHDTVGTLCDLAKSGANVNVVVDRKEASGTAYVREALKRLEGSGVKIASELGKQKQGRLAAGEDPRGIMHDKVILAHHPKTDSSAERWTVMIGSSGLTRNVDQNWNYENLLIIDDKALFDSLMVHHQAASGHRAAGLPVLDERSQLGIACAALEHHVYLADGGWDWARFGDVARSLPPGVHRNVLYEAAQELRMTVWRRGHTEWFGFG